MHGGWELASAFVALDLAIAKANHAMGSRGDVWFVRDENDGKIERDERTR